MTDKKVFQEIESPVQYSELSPGMYTVNCPGKFNSDEILKFVECAAVSRDSGFYNGAFMGIMLPYYLHNANNLMVGVLGNLDLAGMFMPNMEKVGPKVTGARTATGIVVDYLRNIAEAIPSDECVSLGGDVIGKSLTLLKAACGRSVNSTGLDSIDLTETFNCLHPSMAAAALNGMAAWVVISLGGSGSVTGYSSSERIGLKWSRSEGSGLPYMPGRENSDSVIAAAGGMAIAGGMALVIQNWNNHGGEVSLVVK